MNEAIYGAFLYGKSLSMDMQKNIKGKACIKNMSLKWL